MQYQPKEKPSERPLSEMASGSKSGHNVKSCQSMQKTGLYSSRSVQVYTAVDLSKNICPALVLMVCCDTVTAWVQSDFAMVSKNQQILHSEMVRNRPGTGIGKTTQGKTLPDAASAQSAWVCVHIDLHLMICCMRNDFVARLL